MKTRLVIRKAALAAFCLALIITGSYLSIPIQPVPIVLQNLFIWLTGLFLAPGWAVGTIALYLLLGLFGFPVFAGGHGGWAYMIGPTGGYLLSYLPAVLVLSLLARGKKLVWLRKGLGLFAATAILYGIGFVWLKFSLGLEWLQALVSGVLPFILIDAVKAAAALGVDRLVGARVRAFLAPESSPDSEGNDPAASQPAAKDADTPTKPGI